jgi:hypothetical protein
MSYKIMIWIIFRKAMHNNSKILLKIRIVMSVNIYQPKFYLKLLSVSIYLNYFMTKLN